MEAIKKENIFLDLSKLSEEQRKSLPRILRESGELIYDITENMLNSGGLIDEDGDDDFILLSKLKNEWVGYLKSGCDEKTELTYPEFIKLFEGGDDYPGKRYQPLFDHLNTEHGLILHESEMDEIIRIVGGLNSNQ